VNRCRIERLSSSLRRPYFRHWASKAGHEEIFPPSDPDGSYPHGLCEFNASKTVFLRESQFLPSEMDVFRLSHSELKGLFLSAGASASPAIPVNYVSALQPSAHDVWTKHEPFGPTSSMYVQTLIIK